MRREGFSNAFCSSMRYSSPGRSTRKQRQADDGVDRSEILPRSPAQSTVLFSSGRGGGRGREESINDQPSTITELKTSISDVSVDLSAPLFSDKRRASNALAAQHDTDILTNVKAKSKLFSLFQCNEISAVEQPGIRMK